MLEKLPPCWFVRNKNEDQFKVIKKFCPQYNTYVHNSGITSKLVAGSNTYLSTYDTDPWGYKEITFDDFKRLILKEKSPQELLLEEAKLRYPIGTEFYSALPGDLNPARLKCNGGYRFQEDVHGCKNVIWNKDHNNKECGFLYCNGNWAEIINKNTMCTEKTIKLSLDQARKMYSDYYDAKTNNAVIELLLANFSKEELTKKALPKSWVELKHISGKTLYDGQIIGYSHCDAFGKYKDVFATEKQAKSALAMAQLSQLMAVYNDGWEFSPDGNFKTTSKAYAIIRRHNEIKPDYFENNWAFLAFKSAELRDEFLKNFEPLIKEYFMID